jgi:hypothetical protein
MLVGTLSIMTAAIARLPFHFIATGGALAFFGLTDALIVAFVLWDTIKHRRLHPAFLASALFVIASAPLRLLLAGTDVWMHFAGSLVK